MTKVAMFLDSDFPPDPRVESEALSLIKAGHSVDLFTLTYKKGKKGYEVINGIRVHRYPVGRIIYKLSALAYTFPFYRWLVTPLVHQFIKKVQPECLHIHDMVIGETVLNANGNRRPVTLDLHENKPAIMKFYKHTNAFPGNYLISLKKWDRKQFQLIDRADYVIAVTQDAVNYYQSKVRTADNKFVVVPNTVDKATFLGYPIKNEIVDKFKASFNVLYLGDTGERRGLLTAIKSISQVSDNIQNIKLIIVGKSSFDPELRKFVVQLSISDKVIFEGWQDVSLFPSYITASDICIQSSLSQTCIMTPLMPIKFFNIWL